MANAYTQIYIHAIFAVNGRLNLIRKEFEEELYKYITGIIRNKNQKLITINGVTDHIHILISTKPTLDLPKYINTIKGHSSRFLRKEYSSFLRDKLLGSHFWSPSYFIASTGNVSIDVLKQYVEKQQRRVILENQPSN